jgi:sedoheptulose-bisphosphatase
LIRTGETDWAKSGRYIGNTDIDVAPVGVAQVSLKAATLVGAGKLIEPSRIAHVFVSRMRRARKTCDSLLLNAAESLNIVTDDIQEWDYGDYEGLKIEEIRALRNERGLDQASKWTLWRDGCEGEE